MSAPLHDDDQPVPAGVDTDIVLNAEDDPTDDEDGDDPVDDETQCPDCESTLDIDGKCTNTDCPECDDYNPDEDAEEPDED